VTIKPYALQTFDLGKWVVQRPTVAVTVSTTVGRVAVGAEETQLGPSSDGQSLVVAVDQPSTVWTLTPGLTVLGRTTDLRIYDPSSQPTTAAISSPVTGGPSVSLTASVPAGGVITVQLPVTVALPRSSKDAAIVEGPIILRSSEGVGVVAARVVLSPTGSGPAGVTYMGVTSPPSREFVVPGGGAAGQALVVANPNVAPLTVRVYAVRAGGGLEVAGSIAVLGQSRKTLVLPAKAGVLAYLLAAPRPVAAEGAAYAWSGRLVALPAEASSVTGIPVLP
jgi:hypothetical protein